MKMVLNAYDKLKQIFTPDNSPMSNDIDIVTDKTGPNVKVESNLAPDNGENLLSDFTQENDH